MASIVFKVEAWSGVSNTKTLAILDVQTQSKTSGSLWLGTYCPYKISYVHSLIIPVGDPLLHMPV